MRTIAVIFMAMFMFSVLGCETVHDTTEKAGTYIGKGADALGGITEGATDGYVGDETTEENPYSR